MDILKSYFNSNIKNKVLKKKIQNKKSLKRQPFRFKRLSTKRVFVGKGDLKYSNDKVIITFYVYNTEGMYLSNIYHKEKRAIYYPNKQLKILKNKNTEKKQNKQPKEIIVTYNRKFKLNEISNLPKNYEWYISYITRFIAKKNKVLNLINEYSETIRSLVNTNILTESDKLIFYDKIIYYNNSSYPNFKSFLKLLENIYFANFFKYYYLLSFNKTKFDITYLEKLVDLVQKLYYKDVKFNIVNLKKMHLNSDIYTQAVVLKLKDNKNKLYRVLKKSLRKVKVPKISRIEEKQGKVNKKESLINKVRNNYINSMFMDNYVKDSLNKLLLDFFPSITNLKTTSKYR